MFIKYGKADKDFALISVALMILAFSVLNQQDLFGSTVNQIIIIGGWVFLWEAISNIMYDFNAVRKKVKDYRRLTSAEIIFRYKKNAKAEEAVSTS